MIDLLIKLFVKNSNDTKNPTVREAYGLLGSIVGVLCNLILFASKLAIGTIFNSISITADAINNLSDAGSSIITWIGFKLSSKPADEDHPFGHARVEYISGLVVSFLILMLGVELIKSSVDKILHPEPLSFSLIMIIVLILSIFAKLWLSLFNRKLGAKIDSTTLKATATDSMNDVIATSVVLISILISYFTHLQVDGYMGFLVALFIIYSGINLIKETISPLLGEAPTTELVSSIEEKIRSYKNVLGFHDLVVHNYGPGRCFASVHVEVDANEDILKSHDLIDNIEREFSEMLGINLVIHLDPIITDDVVSSTLQALVSETVASIHPALSIHDFRAVQGTTHTNLIFDVTVPPSVNLSTKELAYQIDSLISSQNASYYSIITIDKSYISTTIETQRPH